MILKAQALDNKNLVVTSNGSRKDLQQTQPKWTSLDIYTQGDSRTKEIFSEVIGHSVIRCRIFCLPVCYPKI